MNPENDPTLLYRLGMTPGGYLRRSAGDMLGAAGQSVSALNSYMAPKVAQVSQRLRGLSAPMMGMGGAGAPPNPAAATGGGGGAPTPTPPPTGGGGGGKKGGGGKGGGKAPAGGPDPRRNLLMNRNMLLGGALTAGAIPGLMEMQQGNMVGGATQAAIGGGTAALGAAIGRKNPMAGLAVAGLGQLGSGLLGGRAQVARAEATGATTTEQEAAQKAGRTSLKEDAATQLAINKGVLDQNMSAMKDLMKFEQDMMIQGLRRQEPLLERAKRNELVRNQSMANTLTGNYAMLGTLSTAGKLAQGAQQQAGANFRTVYASNPYANNVMQAPQISF